MFDFVLHSNNEFEFKIDLNVYSDAVVSKVLYWLSRDFTIYRKQLTPWQHSILLKKKDNAMPDVMSEEKIAQLFIDFKVREIINKETEAIRNILYLKAFANYSDLEDLRDEI